MLSSSKNRASHIWQGQKMSWGESSECTAPLGFQDALVVSCTFNRIFYFLWNKHFRGGRRGGGGYICKCRILYLGLIAWNCRYRLRSYCMGTMSFFIQKRICWKRRFSHSCISGISLSLSLSLYLLLGGVPISLCLSVSVCLVFSLSVSFSFCPSLFLCLSISLSVSLSPCIYIYIYIYIYACVYLWSDSVCLSVYLSLYI